MNSTTMLSSPNSTTSETSCETSASRTWSRAPYPSDISDHHWEQINHHVSRRCLRGRHRSTKLREVINAINYRWNTGCTWRMLPHDFPPWGTVYFYFQRWQKNGMLRFIRETLLKPAPKKQRHSQRNCEESPRTSPSRNSCIDSSQAGFSSPNQQQKPTTFSCNRDTHSPDRIS